MASGKVWDIARSLGNQYYNLLYTRHRELHRFTMSFCYQDHDS